VLPFQGKRFVFACMYSETALVTSIQTLYVYTPHLK